MIHWDKATEDRIMRDIQTDAEEKLADTLFHLKTYIKRARSYSEWVLIPGLTESLDEWMEDVEDYRTRLYRRMQK